VVDAESAHASLPFARPPCASHGTLVPVGILVALGFSWVHDRVAIMSAAKPNRFERQRHALISAWRGAPEPPLVNLPTRHVADLIGRVLKEAGLAERAQLEEVLEAWREIVGDFLYQQTKPDAVVRGVLIVRMMQPAVHHALTMEKPRILQKLRERLGQVGIKDLRFRHG
jgi:predicted nucleic acid-binding Zn ribbon protein